MTLQSFAVGQRYPLPLPSSDGTSLQHHGGTLSVLIHYKGVTSKEINQVKRGKVRFRTFVEQGFIIPMVRFGTLPAMELPFNPAIYSSIQGRFEVQTNWLHIYLVELSQRQILPRQKLQIVWFVHCCYAF